MTWTGVPADHLFSMENLPYGVFSTPRAGAGAGARVGVRIGDEVLDVSAVAATGPRTGDAGTDSISTTLAATLAAAWAQPRLNAFLDLGPAVWAAARGWLTEILTDDVHAATTRRHLIPLEQVTMHLPFAVADYVDFYASIHHASNVGAMFRPGSEPLTPNWRHLPIGYHGRSGTIVVSGTDIVRPCGQRKPPTEPSPTFGPSTRLDIEAELGFVVAGNTALGHPVPLARAEDHLFGVVLLNDWSARDIQAWEYVPLGPFLGKSFATSISPWVVTMAALRAARVPLPGQDPQPLPYLSGEPTADGVGTAYGLDISYEVDWNGTVVSRPQFRDMYWAPAQMLAHLTVNGASVRTGDLFASGTVSGPEKETRGCFLELTWSGQEPVTLADGSTRTFLQDGDTVTLRASAPGTAGTRIGLGECRGTILPAHG